MNIYIQLCLIFKRSNNFSGSYGFGWFLAAAWFAPFIVPVLFPGEFPISTLRLAGGAVSAVMGMVLFFKADGIAKPASGQFAGPGAVQQPESTSIGTLDETTDLVARAAALRKAEEAAARNARAMQRPESSEVAVKSKSFGNRSRSFAAMR